MSQPDLLLIGAYADWILSSWKLDTVLVQPHHASGTIETRKAMGRLVRDNLAAHFAGHPLPTPVV